MASQEDYLDNLLKDLDSLGLNETASDSDILNEGNAILEQMDLPFDDGIPEELFAMTQEPIDIEPLIEGENEDSMEVGDFVELSEDEIEKFFVQEQDAELENEELAQSDAVEDIDLMELLEQSDDDELQEIHELLQKSDNNEIIEENQDIMFEEAPQDYMDLLGEISGEADMDESEGMISEKEKKAQERKAKKEERKAAKDAKKQARMEAKLEAKAVKEAQKAVQDESILQAEEELAIISDVQEDVQPVAEDDLADIEALLNLTGDDSSSDDPVGLSLGAAMPFAVSGENGVVEELLKSEEQVDLVKDKHPKEASKKGWFAKFVEFIMEDDEEETIERGNEDVQISDENKNIIDEMDKKKKKKKGQKGTGKADEEKEGAEGENADDGAEKEKKEKKKKKVKKEKIPTELLEDPDEKKKDTKITPKKVMPIVLVCLSLGAVIVLLANLSGDYSAKKAGRKAYNEGDYQTCYQNLYGKELTESEQVMYSKSESILRMRLWYREYELFVREGAKPEALDSLLESVKNYPRLYAYASEWNAATEVAEIYTKMLNILSAKYHLTEEQALEIANTANDMEYSKKVYAIVDGGAYGSWDEQPEVEFEENLRDVLPEEEELSDILFLENGVSAK